MITNTRHVGFVVRDLKRSILFYESLGLKVWRHEEESGTYIDTVVGISNVHIEWAKMRCSDQSMIELLQYLSHPDQSQKINSQSNRLGCSHVAFTVQNIEETCSRVLELGGTIVNKPSLAPSGSVKVVYCHDPDGILIEIVEEI